MDKPSEILKYLHTSTFAEFELDILTWQDEITVILKNPNQIAKFLQQLRDNKKSQFQVLVDLCGVDYSAYKTAVDSITEKKSRHSNSKNHRNPEQQNQINTKNNSASKDNNEPISNHELSKKLAVVYHLLSVTLNQRLCVKCFLNNQEAIPSVYSIYPSAVWYERETWDMYGIKFINNPDHRRILTEYGFEGHPMLKDFPVFGKVELRYDNTLNKIIHQAVSIEETYREYDFMNEWTGTTYTLPGDEKA